ncbi:DegT/DnrJ/EryC1/StrS aminotransferase family protein [Pseudomonadales bacterium]|nr:DegT/DnrJ/EryC1/StrS aminotransferase family protein [Pseudomonadales bacterium]
MFSFPLMRNNIEREDLDAVIELLNQEDPILTNGPNVREFEREWSEWLGVKYSVFVNSGSSANLMSMSILKLDYPDGGEVIVPPLTWVSDIASVIHTGFTPVFADINPRTLAMDTDKIIEKITNKTRAVFLTHVQGFNGLTDKLVDELKKRNIMLIEDVCESHGGRHKDRKLGSLGEMSNFSFYYAHHITTIEGGMVCTNNAETYQKLLMMRGHGMIRESSDQALKSLYVDRYPDLNPQFIFAFPAYNTRNTEIGGIMGRSQLKRIDSLVAQRTKNQEMFFEQINPKLYQTDFEFEGSSNYAFNLILNEPAPQLMASLSKKLNDNGIEFRRGSAGGGNQLRQPYLQSRLSEAVLKSCPLTDHIHFYGMYIGNFPNLEAEEIKKIATVVNQA